MSQSTKDDKNKKEPKQNLPTWITISIVCIICIIIVSAIILGTYFQIKRFQLMGMAIEKGDLGATVLLAAPEIESGAAALIKIL